MNIKYRGIAWFIFQCFTISLTLAIVRFAMKDINIFVMVFVQSCFSLLLILPIIFYRGIGQGLEFLKTKRPKLHILRTICGLVGTSCFFYGATKIPLNDVTAVSFTGPLFTTIAAIVILKEKARKHRIIGLIIGFIGALIVIRPGAEVFNPNIVYIIITVVLMGFVQVLISMLGKTEPAQRMLFYMVFLSTIMTAPFAAYFWVTPPAQNWIWIFALSIFAYINVFSIIMAYKNAEVGSLMPFDFTRLIFTALVAFFVFGENLNPMTALGSFVILASIIYVVHKERKKEPGALALALKKGGLTP